jgi:hypothetical protein
VLGYLSRYTHRVAISNGRLKSADERSVSFDYKDYADGAKHKTMTLTLIEFVRRFCLHILPPHFVKIRHYGFLSNRNREERLAEARTLLKVAITSEQANNAIEKKDAHENPVTRCPFCGKVALIFLREVDFHSTAKIQIVDSS